MWAHGDVNKQTVGSGFPWKILTPAGRARAGRRVHPEAVMAVPAHGPAALGSVPGAHPHVSWKEWDGSFLPPIVHMLLLAALCLKHGWDCGSTSVLPRAPPFKFGSTPFVMPRSRAQEGRRGHPTPELPLWLMGAGELVKTTASVSNCW